MLAFRGVLLFSRQPHHLIFTTPKSLSTSYSFSSSRAMSSSMSTTTGCQIFDTLASKLNDPTILTDWTAPSSVTSTDSDYSTFDVYDPASPKEPVLIATLPSLAGASTVDTILAESNDFLVSSWRDSTTALARSNLLYKWSALMAEHHQDLAVIMTFESGKPMAESLGEVNYAKSFLEYYAAEAVRPNSAGGGFLVPTPFATTTDATPRGTIMAKHQAVGLTAMITPWNFPSAMITRKVGPALAAGCTAVLKPSELTPLSAIALATLAYRAGIPRPVFQVVPTATQDAPTFGATVCGNQLVRKISFTGSTKVGKWLMKAASDSVKRLSLELGGNAPFVVFEDADLDQAVQAAMVSKFRNAGQTCVCADRFLVHSKIHDQFVAKLLEATKSGCVMGHGSEKGTTMGPLISVVAVDSVAKKVEQAIEQGAVCHVGGNKLEEMGPQFYAPTILTNVTKDMEIWKTETFGPVVALASFDTEEQALEMANDSSVGLASYFCTKDLSRAFRFADKLECGIVGVNEGVISSAAAPFGGVKESGLGREGSALGMSEYIETKYIFMNH